MPSAILSEDYAEVARVQSARQAELLSKPNVIGVGIGPKIRAGREIGGPCLTVLVDQKLPWELLADDDRIDPECSGIETDVVESGVIFAGRTESSASDVGLDNDAAFDTSPTDEITTSLSCALTRHRRPALGGDSVGHSDVSTGTIGTAVTDDHSGTYSQFYILSNNHVLANANASRIGDPILQPSRLDGGRYPEDAIGRLARYVPIRFDGSPNLVDAAIAEVPFNAVERGIYWVGRPRGMAPARLGLRVQKTGRTTGYSTGRIVSVNATLDVNYDNGRVGRFAQQILTSRMGSPGDSGSLILDMDERAVGLYFAGSTTHSIANPIAHVARLLKIRLS